MRESELKVVSNEEPSVVESILRVLEAGQRVVLDRIDLARFDIGNAASRTLYGASFALIGAALLATCWLTLVAALVVWLRQYLTLPASLLVGAALSGALGAAVIAYGVSHARAESESKPTTNGAGS